MENDFYSKEFASKGTKKLIFAKCKLSKNIEIPIIQHLARMRPKQKYLAVCRLIEKDVTPKGNNTYFYSRY